VEAARGATLLIHEATFEDEMADEARAKRHSTTRDAMDMAAQSGAYRLILTHFSSRYPTMPEFDVEQRRDVGIAMDFMSINLKVGLPRAHAWRRTVACPAPSRLVRSRKRPPVPSPTLTHMRACA
jgi:hypothetical protein